jgi:UDP-glucose 4-epimerase
VASTTTPGDSIDDPAIEIAQNVFPTIRFIEHLNHYENQRLIYVSSGGAVYDSGCGRAFKETDPLKPLSYHGAGKLSVEFFLQALSNMKPHRITILRPSNLYGPGQPLRRGFGLIRTILEKLLREEILEIWGDGETVRDYIYIEDMIRVIKKLIRQPNVTGTFNVGSNIGHSINAVVRTCETVCGRKLSKKHINARGVDMPSVVLDYSKINAAVDWKPEIALDEGILRTWKWLLNVDKAETC